MRKVFLYSSSALLTVLLVFGALSPALGLEVKVSGQINQMVMWADDGDEDDFFVADNDNSSTRVRLVGEETFGKIKAGIQFEIEAERNTSSGVTIDQTSDGIFNWGDRWLNAYFITPFGKIEVGKGDSAANGTTEVDLSGTAVINYSEINATGGALAWKDDAGTLLGVNIANTRSNFDGPLSRTQRLRYNTPTFAGLQMAGAVENGGAWDASLWYAAELYGKLAAAIGYTKLQRRSASLDTVLAGSVSWLAPFGLNITAAYGKADRVDGAAVDDPTNYYVKLGYRFGVHAVSIEYGMTEDLTANGDESSHYGVAYVINPWKPVELYTSYRAYKLDREVGPDGEDIQVAMAGTRIKF